MSDAELDLERRNDDAHGPDPRQRQPHATSASFTGVEDVQDALERLIRAGVPRDLIEVVVSPEAAREFYPRSARKPGSDALRFAGAGGLIGLVVGSIISLVLIMLPGFFDKGIIPYVQLIGPNFVTAAGALIGGLVGLFHARRVDPRYARALEDPGAIIVIVSLRSRGEAERVAAILSEAGGVEPRVEV